MKVIVADPRRTDTAGMADLFLPIQPGSDVMLFNGMLHIMLWEGWIDAAYIGAHTTGFDELKALVRDATPERVAQVCGISVADLTTAAKWFATSKATLSLYCQGLNQSSSGTAKNAALINLHLATAQIGKPGAGPFSLTGQPNAMGGREVGGLANLLSAHRDLANPQHRAEVAALWGVVDVPSKPGKTAVEMFQAAADGEIKALWIACTNPAQSMPDQASCAPRPAARRICGGARGLRNGQTARYADLLLPATTWAKRTGTVTNSERRISRVRSAVPAPGAARHDWAIAVQFAHQLEARLRPASPRCFPTPPTMQTRAPKPCGTNTAKAPAAATWTSPACRGRCSNLLARSSGRCPRASPPARPACTKTASSPRPTAAPVLPRMPGNPRRNNANRATRSA